MTREEVIEIRDWVRLFRKWGYGYDLIAELFNFECGQAEAVAYDLDLIISTDNDELQMVLNTTISNNSKAVIDYKSGKKSAIGSLIGSAKKIAPHLDAKLVHEKLVEMLK